jgi:IS30 family transposase
MVLTDNEILTHWKNPNFSGSYRGAKSFQIALFTDFGEHISMYRIYKVLKSEPVFLIHQKPIRKITRRPFDVKFYGQVCQSDLAFMFKWEEYNSFLILIDVYSLKLFVQILKSKSAQNVKEAFQKIFKDFDAPIHVLETDRGSEFIGCKKFFKDNKIVFKTKFGRNKASFGNKTF